MAKQQQQLPSRGLVSKARRSVIAVHNVFGPNRPIRQARTGLKTVQAYGAEAEARVLAAAGGIAYLDGVAESNGVGVQSLVNAIKFPQRSVRARPFLAQVAKLAKQLPHVLRPDDESNRQQTSGSTNVVETFDASDDDDDEIFEAPGEVEDFDDETDGVKLKRLEAAVHSNLDTVRWAREETEDAIHHLEQSFRALIKAKDARGDV